MRYDVVARVPAEDPVTWITAHERQTHRCIQSYLIICTAERASDRGFYYLHYEKSCEECRQVPEVSCASKICWHWRSEKVHFPTLL